MSSPPPDAPSWKKISAALDEGLDMSAAEREAWLAALEKTDAGLARRLRELFIQHERLEDSGFLDNSPSGSPDLLSLFGGSLEGKQAGAYLIERLLGRGGMGEVWLASRSDGRFEGRCAIKFLERSIAQPKLAERFRHEGRLLGRVTHPTLHGCSMRAHSMAASIWCSNTLTANLSTATATRTASVPRPGYDWSSM